MNQLASRGRREVRVIMKARIISNPVVASGMAGWMMYLPGRTTGQRKHQRGCCQ